MSSLHHYNQKERLMKRKQLGEFIEPLENAEWVLINAIGQVFEESGSAAYTVQVVQDRLREFMELKGVRA
jgi:hypothetical protein